MKLTDLSVSIRSLVTLSLLVFVVNVHAQTARQFTLNLTDDGKAQMVCFLPQTPSGKAVVGVPGGGYSVLSNTHEGTMASDWMNKQGIAYFVVNYRLPHERSPTLTPVQTFLSCSILSFRWTNVYRTSGRALISLAKRDIRTRSW